MLDGVIAGMSTEIIVYYVFLVVILLISVGLHEYAHAWTSYKLGDPTPVLQGRLTPNPLKHIDIVGLISVFLIGFGWGRPVQINPTYYKNPTRDETLTAFAGPAMNLVLAFVGMLIMMIYGKIVGMGVQDMFMSGDYVLLFWQLFIKLNIVLAIFNMLPFPPLDGFRLIKVFWKKGALWMEKNIPLLCWIFVILLISGPIVSVFSDVLYRLLFMLFSLILF